MLMTDAIMLIDNITIKNLNFVIATEYEALGTSTFTTIKTTTTKKTTKV